MWGLARTLLTFATHTGSSSTVQQYGIVNLTNQPSQCQSGYLTDGVLSRAGRCSQDPAAAARALVAELGGLDSVLADEDKLRRVKLQLDVGSQVTIKVVESLLLSHLDQGPQRLIRHPDLRVFWMKQYASITEVPWFDFWEQFPEQLKENPVELALVSELSNMLGDGRARTAFQLAVERGNKDCISVWELKLAFSGDEGLLPQVERLLTSSPKSKPVAGATKVGTAAASAERQGAPLAAGAVQAPTVMPLSSPAPVVRCQLPPLVSNYTGREDEAAAVVSHLVNHGSIALLAPGGMGKSCLAIDVGWRLMNSGAAAAGALWVDLREASSLAEVEARFCASLGLQAEKQDNAPRILAALKAAAAAPASSTAAESNVSPPDGALGSGQAHMHGVDLAGSGYPGMASRPPPMQVLVVVDNAEDALLHPGAAESVRGLLSKVLREAPSVRMLITSRVTLGMCSAGLTERPVGAIAADAATLLIRSVAADLTEAEAASVADACKCVPLLLCLVAEALVAGRLTLEDLDKLQARGTAGGEPVDATGSTVRLVLSSLKRQHQQAAAQLAVFPSAFDDEAAAAIWGNTPPQARALLAVLHRYSVVQRSSGQHYLMHMVVRRQSAEQGHRIDPGLQLNVEGRFVNWMLGLLREWSVMYHTVKEWRLAMTMARDHQADVSKLFQLLASGFEEGFSGSWKGPAAGEVAPAQGGTSGPRPSPPNGSNSSRSPPPCCWDPAVVASELTDNLRQMFEGLGLLGRMETPCLALLKRLGAEPQLLPPQAPAAGSAPPAPLQHMQPAAGPQPQELQQPLAVASVLYMRAWVRVRGGRMYKEAEEDARRSWELRHAALGPEHPDTVISLYILAAALGYLRRYSEAEVFNRQVLDLQLRLLGELHSDTAYSINGLAVCVDKQGRFTEAEEMYKRALNIRRQVLGERHPCTAGSLNNLAGSIYGQGRRAEAEELYRQALELRRQVIGEEHPDTIATLANLSSCTFDQGRYDEAEPLLRQTLELRRRVLGEDHPDTVQSLTSLAACLDGLEGREAEAEALHRQAVRISLSTLGRTHPTTRSRLVRLGNCMEVQGAAFNAEAVLAELEGSMN
ncbi:hypothetical protein Vretifemale_7987 [Volvox reticuliferus]|uniref:NB-ARC domain-containing protein n=1 Tax=Volvox reticuliferus TaxID=1737510 RepID=A0A8J4CFU0_9CHLO|nr:hypothetical protein Vretifemale_7987 [Volvox reticuliferus]